MLTSSVALAQNLNNPGSNHGNKFEQLGTMLQTPNMYRSASGAPGPKYWQQKADYEINVEIDDVKQRIIGAETVTYFNQSPDPLTYLWMQLDENEHQAKSDKQLFNGSKMREQMSASELQAIAGYTEDAGVKIAKITTERSRPPNPPLVQQKTS